MNRAIPILETKRLQLRSHKLKDFESCVAMWVDPNVTQYTIGCPSSEQRTWIRMMSYLGHWNLMGFGYWAVEEKASGKYIGELGFADFKRDMQPSIKNIPELGWTLATHAHGKGYATEALNAVLAWGDKQLSAKHTVCIINPNNTASLRLANKLGYQEWIRTIKGSEPEVLFKRNAGSNIALN